jgi:hypothetical protein
MTRSKHAVRLPSRGRTAVVLISALLLSTGAGYAALRNGDDAGKRAEAAAKRGSQRNFKIRGWVENLQPGVPARLRIQIRNRTTDRVRVGAVKVRVRDASAGCPRSSLIVRKRRLKVRIPARGLRWTWVPVLLRPGAANACQNATFPLRFKVRFKRRP